MFQEKVVNRLIGTAFWAAGINIFYEPVHFQSIKKNWLEDFSDGAIAIISISMVLEIKISHADSPMALRHIRPVFLSYTLSFVYVGIYRNNHHHLWQVADKADGEIRWANLHLLVWLSLFPFAAGWTGENYFTTWPTMLYGFIRPMAATAWYLLARSPVRLHVPNSMVAKMLGIKKRNNFASHLYHHR